MKYKKEIVEYFLQNKYQDFLKKKKEWKYEPIYNFLRYLCSGSSINASSTMSGLSPSQIHHWRSPSHTVYHPEFVEAIKKARYHFEQANLDKIRKDKSWQSSAWLLERIFPERYKLRVENENKNNYIIELAKTLQEAEKNRLEDEKEKFLAEETKTLKTPPLNLTESSSED